MIPVEKILDAIKEQAKQGSCKLCRWRVCLPEPEVIEAAYTEDNKPLTLDSYCQIQGNVNPIHFNEKYLDEKPYPWKCDEGNWHTIEDNGEWNDTSECLAYRPGYDGTQVDDQVRWPEARKHAEFMSSLAEAMHLYNAIQNNDLAKLTAKLNESKESIPAVPAI